MEDPSKSLEDVAVGYLEGATRQAAEQEIRLAVRVLDAVLSSQDSQPDVRVRVEVAEDFDRAVNELIAAAGEPSPVPYAAMRERSMALAKTFFRWQGERLHATVLVSKMAWNWQDSAGQFYRLYVLLHEMGHLFIETLDQRERNPEPETGAFARRVAVLAQNVLDEFRADAFANRSLQVFEFARDQTGRVLGTADLPIGGPDFAESARKLLDGLCDWAVARVQRYRNTSDGLDQIPSELVPKLRELFLTLAHLLGMYNGAGRVGECRGMLSDSRGFHAYLARDWERFQAAVCSDDRGLEDASRDIEAIILSLTDRMGIRVEDLPGCHWYVHVHEPVFCCPSTE